MAQSPATNTHYVLAREERRQREGEREREDVMSRLTRSTRSPRPVRKRGSMHVYFIPTFPRVPVITCHLSLHLIHPPIQCNYTIVCNGDTRSLLGSITPLSLPRYSSGRRRDGRGGESEVH